MAIKLTERDIEIFKIISKTGSISRGMLEEDFNMDCVYPEYNMIGG